LEYGDSRAGRWLMVNFPRSHIEKALKKSRILSPRSAHFWASILQVPPHTVLCLKKPFREKRSMHWIW
jgi:hypothetical protein